MVFVFSLKLFIYIIKKIRFLLYHERTLNFIFIHFYKKKLFWTNKFFSHVIATDIFIHRYLKVYFSNFFLVPSMTNQNKIYVIRNFKTWLVDYSRLPIDKLYCKMNSIRLNFRHADPVKFEFVVDEHLITFSSILRILRKI